MNQEETLNRLSGRLKMRHWIWVFGRRVRIITRCNGKWFYSSNKVNGYRGHPVLPSQINYFVNEEVKQIQVKLKSRDLVKRFSRRESEVDLDG